MIRIALFVLLFAVVGGVIFGIGATAAAQGSAAGSSSGSTLRWVDHFVVKGGWITWFVLIPLSVATVALAIEHGVSIRRTILLPPDARQRITAMLEDKRYVEAVRFTGEDPSVLGYVVHTALLEAGRGFAAMERALEESLEDRAARLMRKIEYLNVIGNVSPMIGLFGTVYGMIRLFASIRAAGAIPEPAVIADDISIALVTTFWGLAVAIPALSAFAIFRNRIDVLTAECALTSEKLLAVFRPGGETPTQTQTTEVATKT
ncbi:MAG TPA: MotA/TolQ/ExbB proton channel family protein [Phycisphaerae bacterium]|nr:MotA/TolQ/ExbB proton channel family protein [Phycisphaerae bacterium]